MFNYLTRRRNPTPYRESIFLAMSPNLEEPYLLGFQDHRPDYIVFMETPMGEYGKTAFGQDYGIELWHWIQASYTPIIAIEQDPFAGTGFGISVYRLNREEGSVRAP